jgi:HPt (histidine-containing phosphotransfer) domain-containing protein
VLGKPIDRQRLYALLSEHLRPAAQSPLAASAADEPIEQLETRLARRFAARLQGEADALQQELQTADRQAAIARLHRLKGSAPMFGRSDIGALAERAEQALRQQQRVPEACLQQLLAQLTAAAQNPA